MKAPALLATNVSVSLAIIASGKALDYGEFYPAYYEQYTRVSFDDLQASPGKYSGVEICVEGYLFPNYNYSDTHAYTALYEHAFDPIDPNAPRMENRSVSLDPVYLRQLQTLRKRWAGKKVRLYGFYFVPPQQSQRARLHRIPRIDRIILSPSTK